MFTLDSHCNQEDLTVKKQNLCVSLHNDLNTLNRLRQQFSTAKTISSQHHNIMLRCLHSNAQLSPILFILCNLQKVCAVIKV